MSDCYLFDNKGVDFYVSYDWQRDDSRSTDRRQAIVLGLGTGGRKYDDG